MASDASLEERDRALLDRLAERIVDLRLETPAILALESARPVSLLASQVMIFLQPFAQALLRLPDYERLALLVERPEALEEMTRLIERRAGLRAPGTTGGSS